jgi:hypothetical protein
MQRRTKIPHGDVGERRLGMLVAAYYSKEKWIELPPPINRQVIFSSCGNNEDARAWRLYERAVPIDPHRYHQWDSDNLFEQGVPYGQLKLDHPEFELPFEHDWHGRDI